MPIICKFESCNKGATFNYEGQTTRLFCKSHLENGMTNVAHKSCEFEGCKTRPSFNFEGETKTIYCCIHKQEGMVNILSKKCEFEGCKKQPSYNFEGETKAIYCSKHKQEEMIDVKSKKCEFEGCKKGPSCNFEGETKAIYCSEHKQEEMINVNNKTCKYDWCLTSASKKYDGYCLRCYVHTFPDKKVSRNYKTKEYAVVDFVKECFPEMNWIVDKTVRGGFSRRRPDMFLDLGDQVLIIEIDENQHQSYDCSCQNKRTMQLSEDIGHIPLIFIRFNPDRYFIEKTNVTSCWGTDNRGMSIVKKKKQEEWRNRLSALKSQIDYWIEERTEKIVEVIELFYDQL